MAKKVTINQIAAEAGVSPSTVSRVMTGSANVSSERRDKIMELCRLYNYIPGAQSSAKNGSRTIGVVLPDITHPHFNNVFMSAEAQALSRGYTLLLGCTMNDRVRHVTNLEAMYLNIFQQKQVDGIIIMGGMVNETFPIKEHVDLLDELSQSLPVVTINDANSKRGTYHVDVKEDRGAMALVNYLVSLQHSDFAFIGGERDIQPTQVRLESVKAALRCHDLEFDDDYFIPGGFSVESGKKCMAKMLEMPRLPSAVLCLNDMVAIGAIHTAQKAGLRVPEDISIAGSDNIAMTEYITPAITTVDLRAVDIGTQAINVMIDVLEGKKVEKHHKVEGRLVIRESCRMNSAGINS